MTMYGFDNGNGCGELRPFRISAHSGGPPCDRIHLPHLPHLPRLARNQEWDDPAGNEG